jgi:hypothetical protein
MGSLTCVVLLFTVFSLVAVSPAQQASPSAAPQTYDDSDPLPLPEGMTTEAVAESTPARLLHCVADGAGSGTADKRPTVPDADLIFRHKYCRIDANTDRLTGFCVAQTGFIGERGRASEMSTGALSVTPYNLYPMSWTCRSRPNEILYPPFPLRFRYPSAKSSKLWRNGAKGRTDWYIGSVPAQDDVFWTATP